MRIVHTSDWHIGRRFERESMEAEQRAFLVWLAGLVADRRVDLVLVAGDVYDRSLPSEDAVAVLDDGLDALRSAGAAVAMISGNHDSPRRLGFGARRQASAGVHVFADDQHPPEPLVLAAGDQRVALVAVPFLDPQLTPPPAADDDGSPRRRTHEHVLVDALTSARSRLSALGTMPAIAVAHAFVSGAQPSDSERQLAVGGADAVDAAVFAGFDYVALGHLHRPQAVAGHDHVAYSGSPLPYSFSEDHPKSVRVVELTAGGVAAVEEVRVPVGRPVHTLTGALDDLLNGPAHERYRDHWLAVRLTDGHAQLQPMDRLRARFPHVVSVRYEERGERGPVHGPGHGGALLEERPPEDLVLDFLAELRGRPATGGERSLVLAAVSGAVSGSGSGSEAGASDPEAGMAAGDGS